LEKKRNSFFNELFQERNLSKTRLIALIAILSALSNIIVLFSIPLTLFGVTTRIHFIQIPILAASLGIGPISGALVGIIGATNMAFSVIPSNPFIIFYNALLGFFSGVFYILFRKRGGNILMTQILAVIFGYIVQIPFIYFINTQIMLIPYLIVQILLIKILFEDIGSTFIVHPILYRFRLVNIIQKNVDNSENDK